MSPDHRLINDAQSLLTAISARIMQLSDAKASVAMGAATKAVVGATFASSVMGAVGALGTASTGAAIAGLAGAAKTTASLYWIGGLVGGGVAAETLLVGAGALGAGIYGSIKVRRALLGSSRRETLSEREQQILVAVHALVRSLQATMDNGRPVSSRELALFSRLGISPLVAEVQVSLDEGVFAELTTYNRARLRGHVHNLRSLQKRLEHP